MPEYAARQLVYLVYGGKPEYHQEAKFSILSALYRARGECPRILIYTDEPAQFDGWPVEVIGLDSATLTAWTGPASYFHRRKAAAILDSFSYADQSIFIDTDTFFLDSPIKLFDALTESSWLVDEIEGVWKEYEGDDLHKALSSYLADHHGVDQQMLLINSGVLGFREDASHLMSETLTLIDVMHPAVPKIHIIEQFAVGVAARHLGRPAQARGIVKHYFSGKAYWRQMIAFFFQRHGQLFSSQIVDAVRELPTAKPRPAWWQRLDFRCRSLFVPSRYRSQAKLAYYAAVMRANPYVEACGYAYAEELRRKITAQRGNLNDQPWSKVLSGCNRQRLIQMLGALEGEF
ncbi:hypothetical protein F471_03173 [Pseudomonas sp. URMO17WK12:I1]|uniref:hypothetical protein n=1 Tax=unclassified Pseudomonas TaxID=196821 RepID=UPI00068674E8|nr:MULTISPECIES: hypothetical protein [unclassified Pseudomonas]PZW65664.1 hypothetical protein F471_03173 [Pseudomonas sp. URMO17WK12:I1]